MSVNVQYERLALNKILASRNPELLTMFPVEMFGNKDIGNMYRLVRMFYGEHGEFIGWDGLLAELENRVPSKEKLDFLKGMVADIKAIDDSTSTEMILGKLKEQHQFRVLIAGAGDLTNAISIKDMEQSRARVIEMYDAMFGGDQAHNFTAAGMRSMAGKPIKYNFYKTGIKPLDERGGLIEGGLTIIAGESGAGKSTLAQQFLQYSYHNDANSCAIFSFEQSKQELRARILASEGNLDVSLISADLLTPEQRLHMRITEAKFYSTFDQNIADFIDQNKALNDELFWPMFFDHFSGRPNEFYLFDHKPDWDNLFVQMKLLRDTKGVKKFCVDYPYLVQRGQTERHLQQWEYALAMTQKLKAFAGEGGKYSEVLAPAQYDAKEDSLRYVKGAVNACDLFLKMAVKEGDEGLGPAGAVTTDYGKYRNYLSIPGQPVLQPFKLIKDFAHSKFIYMDF